MAPSSRPLTFSSLGSKSGLPVHSVEVTRDTLQELAGRDEVVAILPNQRISPIEPRKVDYEELGQAEAENGLTWGIRSTK